MIGEHGELHGKRGRIVKKRTEVSIEDQLDIAQEQARLLSSKQLEKPDMIGKFAGSGVSKIKKEPEEKLERVSNRRSDEELQRLRKEKPVAREGDIGIRTIGIGKFSKEIVKGSTNISTGMRDELTPVKFKAPIKTGIGNASEVNRIRPVGDRLHKDVTNQKLKGDK